jgi:hypothetical protein
VREGFDHLVLTVYEEPLVLQHLLELVDGKKRDVGIVNESVEVLAYRAKDCCQDLMHL